MQKGLSVLQNATGDICGIIVAFTSGKLKPVADWLVQHDLLLCFPALFDKIGVKVVTDLSGLTTEQLSRIGMKAADITRFTAAVQALKAPTKPPPSTEPVVSARIMHWMEQSAGPAVA